jgi:hypothetical protein
VLHTVPGTVTPAWLDRLDQLLGDHRALLPKAPVDNRSGTMLREAIGYGAYGLGRGRDILGRPDRATEAYVEASTRYAEAGDHDKAEDAAEQAHRVRFEATADIDSVTVADLRRFIDGIVDPAERARLAIRLARRAGNANDEPGACTTPKSLRQPSSRLGSPIHRPVQCAGLWTSGLDRQHGEPWGAP